MWSKELPCRTALICILNIFNVRILGWFKLLFDFVLLPCMKLKFSIAYFATVVANSLKFQEKNFFSDAHNCRSFCHSAWMTKLHVFSSGYNYLLN